MVLCHCLLSVSRGDQLHVSYQLLYHTMTLLKSCTDKAFELVIDLTHATQNNEPDVRGEGREGRRRKIGGRVGEGEGNEGGGGKKEGSVGEEKGGRIEKKGKEDRAMAILLLLITHTPHTHHTHTSWSFL